MVAILTFGATPTMPIPFAAAAIVPAVWVPWKLSSNHAAGVWFGDPADARDAVGEVHVRGQVGMLVIDAGVDVPDHNGTAAGRDRVGLGHLDLGHVPLPERARITPRAAAVVPADADVSTVITSTALVRVANPAVAVAPSTRRSSITALRNEALLERAMTTPISG